MIDVASEEDILHVALNMRESDYREFGAVSPTETREQLADSLTQRYAARGDALAVYLGKEPVAIGAMVEARPNVVTLMFFATDAFPKIALELTRFVKQRLFPRYREAGVHRFECVSIEGHEAAHRWIEILGLEPEAVMPGYGKDGETFHQFAWVRDVRSTGS